MYVAYSYASKYNKIQNAKMAYHIWILHFTSALATANIASRPNSCFKVFCVIIKICLNSLFSRTEIQQTTTRHHHHHHHHLFAQ